MSQPDAALAAAADAIEASAFADMIAAAPAELVRALGLRSTTVGGATLLIAPGIPDIQFNRAIGLGVFAAATEAGLDAVIGAFREAGSKKFWIHWNPHATPASVPQWLAARGFAPPERRSWAKVARGVEAPPEFRTSLEVRGARPGEETAAGEAIAGAFGLPPSFAPWLASLALRQRWRLYVALANARVAGGGYLYLEGRDAWLGAAGVLKEYRGRGGHLGLMALRIRDAAAVGCARIFTETGEPVANEPNPSLANMKRCGFKRVCSRLNYAPPA